MAKYWVGGSGNTNDTAHWSDSDGGPSGATVPTSTDNVIFNASSDSGAGFTVTVNATFTCADFDNSAVDQIMTLAGSSAFDCYGSLTLKSNTVRTYTGVVTFRATSTGKTITTNGVTLTSNNIAFNGAGGGWTLGSALTTGGEIRVTQGSFSSAGYGITSASFASDGSSTRTVNLASSAVVCSGGNGWVVSSTGITFTAPASITLSATSGTTPFTGAGLTYNTLTASGVNLAMSGANTFATLIVAPSGSAIFAPTFSANQTVTTQLTLTGKDAGPNRMVVRSSAPGTQLTITCNGTATFSNTDFQSIVIAGSAAPASGTSLGDGGNNSGITFTSPKTVYAVGTTGWNWNGNNFATSSNGSPSLANFPLPQDTVIIDNSSVNTSATITATAGLLYPAIDCSARSNAMTLNLTGFGITGPLTVNSAVTLSGLTFSLAANQNFNQNSATISGVVVVNNPGTTLTLTGNLTTSSTITYNYGSLALGSYTLTATTFTATQTTTRTLNFGTGKISLTGNNTTIFTYNLTNLTVSGSRTVESTYSGATGTRTVSSTGITEAGSLDFNFTAGTDAVSISSCRSLVLTGFAGTLANGGRTLYGNLTIPAGVTVTAGINATTFGATSGTQTITTNGVTLDFPITFNGAGGTFALSGALTQGSTRRTTLTNGTLDLATYTYTVGDFATATGTKNITFNGGSIIVPAAGSTAFNNAQPTNFTTTAGSGAGTISLTSASAKTFVSGGSTFNAKLNQGGAGALTLTGSCTLTDISNTTQPASVLFTAGTTTTFTTGFSLSGTSGNLITIGSVTAANHTLSKASGVVDVSYCSISRSTATGGASWRAYT